LALTQVFTAGSYPPATTLNESSIPVVSATSDITSPYAGQLVFNTSDTRLWRYTGATWVVFSGGPTWALSRVTSYACANLAWTTVNWDFEDVDTADIHSTSINLDAAKVNQPGLYAITAKGSFAPNATNLRGCRLTLNGTADANAIKGSSVITNNVGGTFTTAVPLPTVYVQLALNDVIRVQLWQNSGGSLNTSTSSAADYPLFTGTWLRD
jgi:hypothetical protein